MIKEFRSTIQFVCLFCLILINGQINAQNLVSIKGNLPDFAGQSIKLQFFATPFQNGPDQADIPVNNEGNFGFQIQVLEAQNLNIFAGNDLIRFYVVPGDTLTLQSSMKDGRRNISFSGKGAKEAAWFDFQQSYFQQTIENTNFSSVLIGEMTKRNGEDFKKYLDSLILVKLNFLKKHEKKLSKEFVDWQSAEIIYEFESFKINYPNWYYSMRGIENKTLSLDSSYFNYLKKMPLNKTEYLGSGNYRNWLKYYFMHELKKQNAQLNASELWNFCGNLFGGEVLKTIRMHLWSDIMLYGQFSDATSLYETAKKELKDIKGFDILEARYKEKLPFSPGAKAFPFTLNTIDGKQVSLSDFKGKVVYIDFWASWCGPCKREIPAGEDLKKYFEGKDVVFLNISIDENEDKWKESAIGNGISGIHLITNSKNHPEVIEAYQVNSIPSYFLIGKDGKFIAAPAVRPSNGTIYPMIENALK